MKPLQISFIGWDPESNWKTLQRMTLTRYLLLHSFGVQLLVICQGNVAGVEEPECKCVCERFNQLESVWVISYHDIRPMYDFISLFITIKYCMSMFPSFFLVRAYQNLLSDMKNIVYLPKWLLNGAQASSITGQMSKFFRVKNAPLSFISCFPHLLYSLL